MLLIYIFIIIILLIVLSIKQIIVENFKTFSNTQELGLDEKDIIKRGINFDSQEIINKIPLIQYPNMDFLFYFFLKNNSLFLKFHCKSYLYTAKFILLSLNN